MKTVVMLTNYLKIFGFYFLATIFSLSCEKEEIIITPEDGYDWPDQNRSYWPTNGWITAPLEDHNMDPQKMTLAHQFASNDPLTRALLVIKDGYLVYENYYGDGGIDQSTNLWSVTKSFTSAVLGLVMDMDSIKSTTRRMAELMPDYPEFNAITLQHVLTQTTGLSWAESGPLWVDWIKSDDWVRSALARGHKSAPGKKFFYSSGNSHFLTSLVFYRTGISPGKLAKDKIFDPLGIPFDLWDKSVTLKTWDEYLQPLDQTWTCDSRGIECAGFGLFLTARDMAKFGYLYLNRGRWDGQTILSEKWITDSTKDHETNIYGRYSYGYQWWITKVAGYPAFLASGFGGQILGVVPSLDMVVVLKYRAENAVHPVPGSAHDDMHLFDLVVQSVSR